MYVNTNTGALNSWMNLLNTQQNLTNALEQLSTGNRINTAADDPAGLAISQQMLTQIDGMQQANSNAQTGISLLQTADGALGQIQNILQSMRSLASEAATATMNPTDLQNLQTEMNQYAKEITQITNTTQFNNLNLLGGAFNNQDIQIGANAGQQLVMSFGAADAATLGVAGETVTGAGAGITNGGTMTANGLLGSSVTSASFTLNAQTTEWQLTNLTGNSNGDLTAVSGTYAGATSTTYTFDVTAVSGGKATAVQYSTDGGNTWTSVSLSGSGTAQVGGLTFTFGGSSAVTGDEMSITATPETTVFSLVPSGSSNAVVSATVDGVQNAGTPVTLTNASQTEALSLVTGSSVSTIGGSYTVGTTNVTGTATTATLGSGSTTITVTLDGNWASGANGVLSTQAQANSGLSIQTQGNAQVALTIIDNAINQLSTERANVGAYQNRLQFAASDLQTSQENLQSARGGITNADMALEMSKLAQYQILQQSGVAMLAQADAIPQALLKLLP
jgi:flagellin